MLFRYGNMSGQIYFAQGNCSMLRSILISFAMIFAIIIHCACCVPASAKSIAPQALDARTILERARTAAGGDRWANAQSLILKGRAVFWGKEGAEPTSRPDTYIMYREFDPNRMAAHGAEGKVRIIMQDKGRTIIDVGFDGATTWNEKGIIPKDQADAFWASNFGFGIIRHALKPGFTSQRLADGNVDGFPVYMIRLMDPAGTESLFGIDHKSYAIRMVGFDTPKGWHVRTYSGFFRPKSVPWWLQARVVTLYYNGVKQNEIHWQDVVINPVIDPALFAPPMTAAAKS
jgi:hypothetical protein